MLNSQKITALSVAAALGFIAYGQSATAQDSDAPSVKVRYADLNLTSEDGAQALLQRIHHAARIVCDQQWSDSTEAVLLGRSCVAHATSRAVAKLNSPLVTALYSGKPMTNAVALATNP